MDALAAKDVISLWERGRRASVHARALLLLAHARPELSVAAAAALPIGRRDAELARLRKRSYGAVAPAFLECPSCAEGLEFAIDLDALLALAPAEAESEAAGGLHRLVRPPFELRFRLPTTEDLMAIARAEVDASATLLRRCVVAVTRGDDPDPAEAMDPTRLPAEIVAALEAELEALDPVANVSFAQTCPACGHRFTAPFDVARYLWHEVDVDARRVVQEVDALARVYGWSEAEILAMSRTRRLTYLEVSGVL